jgi:hypothetical protein
MLKVKYSDFVAGSIGNKDLVLSMAQRSGWLWHSTSLNISGCKGHFAEAEALGV